MVLPTFYVIQKSQVLVQALRKQTMNEAAIIAWNIRLVTVLKLNPEGTDMVIANYT